MLANLFQMLQNCSGLRPYRHERTMTRGVSEENIILIQVIYICAQPRAFLKVWESYHFHE